MRIGGLAVGVLLTGALHPLSDARASQAASNPSADDRSLIARYCVTCHNDRLRTAQLTLEQLDPAEAPAQASVWEKVIRKLRAGAMPPMGSPRPDPAAVSDFVATLERTIDHAAANRPHPGRPASAHRLNRAEYRNAIRDLLAVGVDVADLLPPDSGSFGFDNIGDVLGLSPLLIERYLSAARRISRVAIGSASIAPTTDTFRVPSDLTQDTTAPGQPFGTRGGLVIPYTFPLDGAYDIRLRLARESVTDAVTGIRGRHDIDVTIDGVRVKRFTLVDGRLRHEDGSLAPEERGTLIIPGSRRNLGFYGDDVARVADEGLRVRVLVRAGPRLLGVTFARHSAVEIESIRQPFLRAAPENGDSHGAPYLSSVAITGPFDGTAGGDTPSRRRLLTCQPSADTAAVACARRILSTLARRAYRRPVTPADVNDLLAFFREGRAAGGFDAGIELALTRLLVGPAFLLRMEFDPPNARPGSVHAVSDVELASRLSFFLWSSIPDEELLTLAERGRLRDPGTLERQVRRMLADLKAHALVENFVGQWLYLRNVPHVRPDRQLFPDFDENLRQAFRRETELFVEGLLRDDRPALELLTANYSFINERLARHYGVRGVYGERFRRVTFEDGVRGGLLGQGSILTVRSYVNRTSPVLRGVWILENILGAPPPPPPPNVPALVDTDNNGQVLSMRERMVQHRRNPACAGCHAKMDPLGLPLEQFDAVGRLRVRGESNEPLDLSGALPNGKAFTGVTGLRQALVTQPDEFLTTVTEKMLTYALGRGLEYSDAPAVRGIIKGAAGTDHRLSSLIVGIVKSAPFQQRQAADAQRK